MITTNIMMSDKIDKSLIDQITDRFLYLDEIELKKFKEELQLVLDHYKTKRTVNHDLTSFKFPLHHYI